MHPGRRRPTTNEVLSPETFWRVLCDWRGCERRAERAARAAERTLAQHPYSSTAVVARCVKMRALGARAMGAAGTLPGDLITGIAPSLVVLIKVRSPNLRSERPGERATECEFWGQTISDGSVSLTS